MKSKAGRKGRGLQLVKTWAWKDHVKKGMFEQRYEEEKEVGMKFEILILIYSK